MTGAFPGPDHRRARDSPPAVSVLVPVRDSVATLASCLRSVQRQLFADWECVVVDDGSADGSVELARRVAAADPRLLVVARPPRGLVAALNDGLSHCRGSFIARMDADDVMHRQRLARQVAALARDPGCVAVGCHVRMVPRRGLTDGRRAYEAWLNSLRTAGDVARDAFVECPIAHPTLMIRRDVLQRLRYRDVGWAEDYDLILRLLQDGGRIGMVPQRLLLWSDTPGRLSRTDPRYGLARFTACKAEFLSRGYLAGRETYVLWGYGETGKALSRALTRHGLRPSHILEVHPGRIGGRIRGAPVAGLDALRGLRGRPLVVSVAGAAARAEIRAHLASLGFVDGRDFVCAA